MIDTHARPSTPECARRAVSTGRQVGALAGSALRSWSRDPGIMIQTIVFPVFLLLMFQLVLGKTVTAMGGGGSVYRNVALTALVGVMYGALATGAGLVADRESGLLGRLWTLPVSRGGFVAARLCAEVVRAAVGTAVLFAIGAALGFRWHQGILAGIAALGVAAAFGLACACMSTALATRVSGKQVLMNLSALYLLMLFFTTGFAPASEYPGWLRPIVRYQPMSPAIDAIRGLTEGGAVARPLAISLAWSVAFVVVFGALSVTGFRRAAAQRT